MRHKIAEGAARRSARKTGTPSRRQARAGLVAVSALMMGGWVSLTPVIASAADVSPPAEPGRIAVLGVTASGVALKWGGSKDNVAIEGYRVFRSTLGGALSLIATTDAVTSYTANNLRSNHAYVFGVTAIDAADNQSPMRTVAVSTSVDTNTVAPAAPSSSSVVVTPFSSSRLDVIWGPSTSNDVAFYRVIRDGAQVGVVESPSSQRYSDNGLLASTKHSYSIVAVSSAGVASPPTAAKSATTLAPTAVKIARGPYLSDVSGTSAVVSWWTNIPTAGVVSVGGRSVTDPAGSVQHHAVRVTGLRAATTSPYTVHSGNASSGGTLRTAARRGQPFSFAAIGDFGGQSIGETQNAANIGRAGTQFVQTLGDNIYPSAGLPDPDFTTTLSDFDTRFYRQFGPVVRSQAFFPANGNKEYYGNGEFWNNFPMPGSNHSWYSYNWGDAHILVVDTEQPYGVGTPQYQFVQADLAANQGAAWRIVAMQRPPYSSTSAHSNSGGVQRFLVPLFQAQHVNLVLSGNSHNYERSFPLVNGARVAAGGVTYIVSGGGGSGFNAFNNVFPQPARTAVRESSFYEFTKVTVTPTTLTAAAVRADTDTVFDSTTITKPGTPIRPPAPFPTAGVAQPHTGAYLLVSKAGRVYNHGTRWLGSPSASGVKLSSPVVGIVAEADGGYVVVTAAGSVYPYGTGFYGSPHASGIRLSSPVIGVASGTDNGYVLLTAAGSILNYGTRWAGSPASGGAKITSRLVGVAGEAGGGYVVLTSAGGVLNYGTRWAGSPASQRKKLSSRLIGVAAAPRSGYVVATAAGNVYNFGTGWLGSPSNGRSKPATSFVGVASGGGYTLATSSGTAYSYY